jgi:hypothetical protein
MLRRSKSRSKPKRNRRMIRLRKSRKLNRLRKSFRTLIKSRLKSFRVS